MIVHENQCVGCPPEMGCLGSSCSYNDVIVAYCDECGYDTEVLYEYNGKELCEACVLKMLPRREYH